MSDIKKLFIIGIGAYITIAVMNHFLGLGNPPPDSPSFTPVIVGDSKPKKKLLAEEVVRKNRLVPGMDFEESTFYVGTQEIARQKIVGGKIMETTGDIPDGKVKFIDEYLHTYGEEFYLKGKKHGLVETYYEGGKPKSSSNYLFGKLMAKKEFYGDGALRMEEDFEDAIFFAGEPDRETGVGKVYFRDGTLKYEWSFTNTSPSNYKKSYDQTGALTLELFYDKDGNLI